MASGDAAGAAVLLRSALAAEQRLAVLGGGHADLQRDVAATQHTLGCALEQAGDPAGALTALQAALAGYEGLAARQPGNPEYRHGTTVARASVDRVAALPNSGSALSLASAAPEQPEGLWARLKHKVTPGPL